MADVAYQSIGYPNLAVAIGFVVLAVVLSRLERLGLEKALVIGSIRACVQLMAMGFVLGLVFAMDRWYHVVPVVALMIVVGSRSAHQRVERRLPGLQAAMMGAIAAAVVAVMAPVTTVVLRLEQWYQPQYLIPISGMIIGNATTGCAVAADRLLAELVLRRDEVEAMLCLGASWRQAARASVRAALRAGWMPTINAITVYGIVQLPGMMTGQVIGGVAPLEAVKYQVLIAHMLVGAVAISSYLTVRLACSRAFTKDHQFAEWVYGGGPTPPTPHIASGSRGSSRN